MGISGRDGRLCAPGDRQQTDSLSGIPPADAGDGSGDRSPPRPPRPQRGRGGVTPPGGPHQGPDPYLNPAARAYMGMCADVGRIYPGWEVFWKLDGFRARQGKVVLGPVSSPSAIGALLSAETQRQAAS